VALTAMPMLADVKTSSPETVKGRESSAEIRSAIHVASLASAMF
jgi:hypothetical protein